METVIGVLLIIMGIFLIISVLMQSSKNHRLSGSIAGGAETFFGKQKGKTLDALFNKLTTVVTIVFVLLVLVLYVIQPSTETLLEQYGDQLNTETEDGSTDGTENGGAVTDGTETDGTETDGTETDGTETDANQADENNAGTENETADTNETADNSDVNE